MTLRLFTVKTARHDITIRMDLDLTVQSEWWINHHFEDLKQAYEPEVTAVMLQVLRAGDVAIDVGANVGFFTLVMASAVGETGKVLAFEPGPNVLPKLRKNLGMNPQLRNVELVERPLWCREEKVTLWLDSDSGGGGNSLWDCGLYGENTKSRANPRPVEMEAATLDVEVATQYELPAIRLIKLDTEGTELQILEGAKELLDRHHPDFVITELNPFGMKQMGCSAQTFRDFMAGYGYDCFLLHDNGALPSLLPSKSVIGYYNGIAVLNVLFSTTDAVAEAWPQVPF